MDQTVVITIPVNKTTLSELGEISLTRCLEVLGSHPIVFFGPESLDYEGYLQRAPGASVERFPDRYFGELVRYTALMLSPVFYERFLDYRHLLIHHTDAFVFRDELLAWCARDFDYIGGPWWSQARGWIGVGNGGFCLRQPARCLEVFKSKHKETARVFWDYVQRSVFPPWKRWLYLPRKMARQLGIASTVDDCLGRVLRKGENEDLFWGFAAPRYLPGFRVAPVAEALEFSMAETGFELALAQYHQRRRPPFGCHHNVRYLRWVQRFQFTNEPPQSKAEGLFWELAEMSGMRRCPAAT